MEHSLLVANGRNPGGEAKFHKFIYSLWSDVAYVTSTYILDTKPKENEVEKCTISAVNHGKGVKGRKNCEQKILSTTGTN